MNDVLLLHTVILGVCACVFSTLRTKIKVNERKRIHGTNEKHINCWCFCIESCQVHKQTEIFALHGEPNAEERTNADRFEQKRTQTQQMPTNFAQAQRAT